MIIGGYRLLLYCDCVACAERAQPEDGEFVGETYPECARQARAAGWKIDKANSQCFAPGHAHTPQAET
ncbi:hypothetical protein SAMN02745129_2354 [Ferrimonas marina]|uniref:Uncharacterized protein n=1 Tax=Ferrimonas marina TaxID=299255 RepID=A0A1M5U1G1_9GAMM|nr:hypothetical protein SAMN02745129_2354 [Ferrimonas marina]